MKLRNLVKTLGPNDGTRTLFESILPNEVSKALSDWKQQAGNVNAVLIGGLALSYYVKPRMTQDVDYLFMSDKDIPAQVNGFKRTRPGAFQHDRTHVEIEMVTPKMINADRELIDAVFATAVESDGVKIASPSGLVALKLNRLHMQDKADIVALLKTGKVDVREFPITTKKLDALKELEQVARAEGS